MDKKIIFGSIGSILKYLGILMIVPLAAAWYGERTLSLFIIKTWLVPLVITTSFGVILERKMGAKGVIKRREGFVIVALGWLAVAIFGSLPYVFSATLGPMDAFFESMSGFTTTGSTVMLFDRRRDFSAFLCRENAPVSRLLHRVLHDAHRRVLATGE